MFWVSVGINIIDVVYNYLVLVSRMFRRIVASIVESAFWVPPPVPLSCTLIFFTSQVHLTSYISTHLHLALD